MDEGAARRLAWACQHGECAADRLNLPCPLYTQWEGNDVRITVKKHRDCKHVTAEMWLKEVQENEKSGTTNSG